MSSKQLVEVDGKEFTLSNVDKIFFPGNGFTKGEVIGFYSAIAETIIPHLHDRPLTMKRYPDGITSEPFYEKNAPSHRPDWVETFAVPRSSGGEKINYVLCNNRPTLLWASNLGDIEKHTLLARAPGLNCPTSIVFDLDPGEPAGLLDCCRVAQQLRGIFDQWGLQSFAKVSGSKGLHLSVPLNSPCSYEVTQPFAKAVAQLVTQQSPESVVFDMAKALRKGKVLIDWSQNSDFKTTVAVYAMRAKHSEPFISMPVTWDEIGKALRGKRTSGLFFTPAQAIKRISRLGDLFRPVLELQQELPTAFTEALRASPQPKLTTWQRHQGKPRVRDKSLREYDSKRDHSQTAEPAARPAGNSKRKPAHLRFVIQKHEASRLHYDWRLEMDGVLRSWAVPKGPPFALRETRLAMHVEDHPMDYAGFEGTIPKGNYGAGTVMVWDEGEYEDVTGDPAKAFHAGKMHLILNGKKLKGEWILVKDRRDEGGNRWLLIKAGTAMKPLTPRQDDTSAISQRSMKKIASENQAQWESVRPEQHRKKGLSVKNPSTLPKPSFIEPMQCKSVKELPEGGDWNHEMKFDGYRCLAMKEGGKTTLFSRNEKALTDRFPVLAEAFARIDGDVLIDGEVVALDGTSRPSFQLLQNSRSSGDSVFFYAFDLLHHGGESIVNLPHSARRSRLEDLFQKVRDPLRISPLIVGTSEQILTAVGQLGLEGVVSKRSASKYEAGERSGAWTKLRTNRGREFVIGGYVPGNHGFDMLLVGVHEGGKLQYCAKVRNGFVPKLRSAIFPLLKKLPSDKCPFVNLPEKQGTSRWGDPLTKEKMAECRWVKPKLVCQVDFVEWTTSGKLRHPSFIAMRDDKPSKKVVRED